MDLLLDILKFAGLAVTAAIAIISHFGPTMWRDASTPAAAPQGRIPRSMTRWGWWSLALIICGAVVTLGAQIFEAIRAKQKDVLERQEKEAQQKQHQQEIARIQRENQAELARRLAGQSLQLAELFFQGRELDSQRAAFLEKARLAGADITLPAQTNTFSSSNLTAEIQKALNSIPDELRAASAARNQAEAELLATKTKAKEVDKAIRPQVLDAWVLLQSVLAQAQREGLVTITNIEPIPPLPDRLVYARGETNFGRLERFFPANHQQRIEFAHGDVWVIATVPGILESTTVTNDSFYPKIRIGRPASGPSAALATLSFNPTNAEIRITGTRAPQQSDTTLKPEDRVAGALVDVLRQSVLKSR